MSARQRRYVGSGVVLNLIIIVVGIVAIVALLLTQLGGDGNGDSPLPAVAFSLVAEGLDGPVVLSGDGTGAIYVAESGGLVLALGSDGAVGSSPFLDLGDRVLQGPGAGLLGLAFHPDFAHNGRLFVSYIRAEDEALSISEFQATDGEVDVSSERPILVIPRTGSSLRAGSLAFDDAGMLLIGVGGTDGDAAGNAPDPAVLAGALLRLDVDHGMPYAIPSDNGFVDQRDARGEVQAIGLREPAHISVDRETGHVYIGDVGQDQQEIDVLPPGSHGASFGWPEMDGNECRPGGACDPAAYITPAVTLPESEDPGSCAIVGGDAYRGTAGSLPGGTYLFADRCSGTIWSVPASRLQEGRVTAAAAGTVPRDYGSVTGFGEDDAGELYVLTDGGYVLAVSEAA